MAAVAVGDWVKIWIGPPKRGGWEYGTVVGIDNLGHPGIEIKFERLVHGLPTCYATHDEVKGIRR